MRVLTPRLAGDVRRALVAARASARLERRRLLLAAVIAQPWLDMAAVLRLDARIGEAHRLYDAVVAEAVP